ncbi:MAG: hypothetical protein HOH04_08505 [Rhodospirillaceae bacterium]|jgi:hypothetical protein|nr:hypothetical protein [Rhodospirillaceae bacterium]
MGYRQWEISIDAASHLQREGLAYWRSLIFDKTLDMPWIADFDLMGMPPALLPTTHIVDVLNGGEDFRFRFWGSGFRNFMGEDCTGKSPNDLMPIDTRKPVCDNLQQIVDSRRAIAIMSEFERAGGAQTLGFQRIIRMPLAAPDRSVGQIVTLTQFLMEDREALKLIEEMIERTP